MQHTLSTHAVAACRVRIGLFDERNKEHGVVLERLSLTNKKAVVTGGGPDWDGL